jgi:hypothetical protein
MAKWQVVTTTYHLLNYGERRDFSPTFDATKRSSPRAGRATMNENLSSIVHRPPSIVHRPWSFSKEKTMNQLTQKITPFLWFDNQTEEALNFYTTLFNFEPPASGAEIESAALQFARKVSGFNKPSKANEAAFLTAVDEITAATRKLLTSLETNARPKNREAEATRRELARGPQTS